MDLAIIVREKFGKANKALRQSGLIPAELYGHGVPNKHLAVNARDFNATFKEAGESTIVNLTIGKEKHPALVHDVQRDFLSGAVTHVDFYQVRMDEKIKAHIQIEFLGEAPAVKEHGGFLNKTMSEIEVEAFPKDLPNNLSVDLGALDELNKSLYVKDIPKISGVKILIEPDAVIATVMPPKKEEEEKVQEPVNVAEIKVEGEEKKAERAAEKAKEQEEK